MHTVTYINKVKAKIGYQLNNTRLLKQVCTDSQLCSIISDLPILLDKEMCKLDTKYGFKYRTATGMLLFACVLCHLDIGFLVITLSKYNHQPNEEHFEVAAQVLKYLITTKNKGIIYYRTTFNTALPSLSVLYSPETHEEPFLIHKLTLQLADTTDASFALDIEQ